MQVHGRAAGEVGSQARSRTRLFPALCVGQGLFEQHPWEAAVNLILDGHRQGLPVVPLGLSRAGVWGLALRTGTWSGQGLYKRQEELWSSSWLCRWPGDVLSS